ncbi:hypothetical protein SUGI_0499080 [Cryptomeria japonica]|uniref:proteinaceous RNase P 1, chloroplastic/mitochondrial isoform X2 n=1 Tax=Cryptomeria japonica TaxID=3369 RepID=UPI002408A83E|nr:proteinaceous RNase P 1, chloroplastic/mitochondrial isoform X2 [Cryptomeria japonica]GLJ26022.1 hypothetical protein SUGI_0499080 [Cryptomeria japonica]
MDSSKQNERQPPRAVKKKNQTPEGQLRFCLETCSKHKDISQAISLYEKAMAQGIKLNLYHCNTLLYLCSSEALGLLRPEETLKESDKTFAFNKGFEIYRHMISSNIPPNEATLTAVARLAAANEDGDMAFEMVKKMVSQNLFLKLRSYSPALLAFCKRKEADKAYEVDEYMVSKGVKPEEEELRALLRLSIEVGREEKVYSLMHRLRANVRQVSPSTCEVIEQWFKSKVGAEVGKEKWDAVKIREAMVSDGGGGHGQGWLGKGNWRVEKTIMSPEGVCQCCGKQLVSSDIDSEETETFAQSLARLACEREANQNFKNFQGWLDCHGPYEYIVDGANVCLYQQNFSNGGFNIHQLKSVVEEARQRSLMKKWPLIILHNKRTRGGPADEPYTKQLFEDWRKSGALYTTPTGSNDDWYWLYAAVRFKCFLVTNDQMRDHLFEILGNEFFPKWRESHQVYFTFNRLGPQLHMPPPYSVVIQESETGSWHIPIKGADDIETVRSWLCVTRSGTSGLEQRLISSEEGNTLCQSQCLGIEGICVANTSAHMVQLSTCNQNTDVIECSTNFTKSFLPRAGGKRKSRSSSPSSPS